jgi:hypothetical protein
VQILDEIETKGRESINSYFFQIVFLALHKCNADLEKFNRYIKMLIESKCEIDERVPFALIEGAIRNKNTPLMRQLDAFKHSPYHDLFQTAIFNCKYVFFLPLFTIKV